MPTVVFMLPQKEKAQICCSLFLAMTSGNFAPCSASVAPCLCWSCACGRWPRSGPGSVKAPLHVYVERLLEGLPDDDEEWAQMKLRSAQELIEQAEASGQEWVAKQAEAVHVVAQHGAVLPKIEMLSDDENDDFADDFADDFSDDVADEVNPVGADDFADDESDAMGRATTDEDSSDEMGSDETEEAADGNAKRHRQALAAENKDTATKRRRRLGAALRRAAPEL